MTEHKQSTWNIQDDELDVLLTEWAETELDVPEGFHEQVMLRLQTEAQITQEQKTQSPQKKGTLVSLSERFANKKAWVSTVAAAALVLCCLPILQDRQDNLVKIENNTSQVYELQKRTLDDDGTTETIITMNNALIDTQASPATNGIQQDIGNAYDAMDSMEKHAEPLSADKYRAESRTTMSPAEQLALAQDNLAELESHLAMLDDSAEAQALRESLLTQIDALKTEIETLEEEIEQRIE